MKDRRSLHLKVQEMCDCYASTDPLKEMSAMEKSASEDVEESAIKWLALAILHGITEGAEKISLTLEEDGSVNAKVQYRKATLPSPPSEVGKKAVEIIRQITHIETPKGKLPLAVGIRDSSTEVIIKLKKDNGKEKLTIKFPD
ncbi:hypothetical protein [Thermodesulforhabdus norvegica]|uniref:Uncharacterized protein n=1 Tax=Thermodesulforhabdus norvegica TaxID=39841 RepID=A0A1I4S2N1_9BACT|nr:hypothetical protein [Thermodesulforhabdus norvegica]SFM58792.1 hypothetical protein SAMN05660836_00718 [Thermodesulforhabdus norvegica]